MPVIHPYAHFAPPRPEIAFPTLDFDRLACLARLGSASKPRLEDPAPALLIAPVAHRFVSEHDHDVRVLLLPSVGLVHRSELDVRSRDVRARWPTREFLPMAEAGFARPPERQLRGKRVNLARGLTGETGFPPRCRPGADLRSRHGTE